VLVLDGDISIALLLAELRAGMGHDFCATAATEAEAVIAAARYASEVMSVDAGWCRRSDVSAVEEILWLGQRAHVFVSGDAESVRVRRPEASWFASRHGRPILLEPSKTRSLWHARPANKSIAAWGTTTDKSCPVILRMLSPD